MNYKRFDRRRETRTFWRAFWLSPVILLGLLLTLTIVGAPIGLMLMCWAAMQVSEPLREHDLEVARARVAEEWERFSEEDDEDLEDADDVPWER